MDSKELEAVLAVVRCVLEENHAYYMAHPDYPMPKPCMWPAELMGEIAVRLAYVRSGAVKNPSISCGCLSTDS